MLPRNEGRLKLVANDALRTTALIRRSNFDDVGQTQGFALGDAEINHGLLFTLVDSNEAGLHVVPNLEPLHKRLDRRRHDALEFSTEALEICSEGTGAAGHDAIHQRHARVNVPQVLQEAVQVLGACGARTARPISEYRTSYLRPSMVYAGELIEVRREGFEVHLQDLRRPHAR